MERFQNLWKSINTILIHRYLRYSNANSLWNAKTKWKNVWKRIISYKPHSMLFTIVLCIKIHHIDITENQFCVSTRKSGKAFHNNFMLYRNKIFLYFIPKCRYFDALIMKNIDHICIVINCSNTLYRSSSNHSRIISCQLKVVTRCGALSTRMSLLPKFSYFSCIIWFSKNSKFFLLHVGI